jgi:hypothetical protein
MDGHAEHEGVRADQEQEGGPRQHYWIIRGTLLWRQHLAAPLFISDLIGLPGIAINSRSRATMLLTVPILPKQQRQKKIKQRGIRYGRNCISKL